MSFFDDQVYFANEEAILRNFEACPICASTALRVARLPSRVFITCSKCRESLDPIYGNQAFDGHTVFASASYDKVNYKGRQYWRTRQEAFFVKGLRVTKEISFINYRHHYEIAYEPTKVKKITTGKFIKKFQVKSWSAFMNKLEKLANARVLM